MRLEAWELALTAPGVAAGPAELPAGLAWIPARVPGTAASALRAAGAWHAGDARDFDGEDTWWRCQFAGAAGTALCFDGLATVAEVWLNGERVLESHSMYVAHVVDVAGKLRAHGENELIVCCRALAPRLAERRARPRWKTRLCSHQQLRWWRTSLYGRMPGWAAAPAASGPWRPVRLEKAVPVPLDVRVALDGDDGVVTVVAPGLARLRVGAHVTDGGVVRIARVERWWPHTHGAQPRYDTTIEFADGRVLELGKVAFRTIEVDRSGEGDDGRGFALRVNGVRIFARGAVWSPADAAALIADDATTIAALAQARAAGMNLLRVGGTMCYEGDAFYDACDALGLLVWQDFMFANMDYPIDDQAFAASVRTEAACFLARTQTRASLAVLCGGSEVAQQAAMLGLPRELWSGALFDELLPAACAAARPDVPYVPNSPSGGDLPFRVDTGVAHYYGVGAYRRGLDDARRAQLRFAAESLAFANVPDDKTVHTLLASGQVAPHHPAWKARVPRDHGAGWDFEDVRDHYLACLYRVDPVALRSADPERYLALSRVVTGEVMAAAFAEWRRAGSTCAGALVWLLRDAWPGAGFGVVDGLGRPKAAWHYLRRALARVALFVIDEGLNGLALHAVNDGATPLAAQLRVALFRDGHVAVASGATRVDVPARGACAHSADALLEGFRDSSYAYRFGPPGHDLVVATLVGDDGAQLAQVFHFPLGLPAQLEDDVGLEATLEGLTLHVRARRFAQSVHVDLPDFDASDDYFHVAPGGERVVQLTGPGRPVGTLQPLNARMATRVR